MTDESIIMNYNGVHIYPPVNVGPHNGALVMNLFACLKENKAAMTAKQIFQEIVAHLPDRNQLFEPIIFDAALHDAQTHQKFPMMWEAKENDALTDKKTRRAVALSPSVNSGFLKLSLNPGMVIVGYRFLENKEQAFMVVIGKNSAINYTPETLEQDFLKVDYVPGLYHQVEHLKKLCTGYHP